MRIWNILLAATLMCGAADVAAAYPAATRSALNMRQGPSTGTRVAAVLPRAAVVDVRSCTQNWCQVVYRGRTGYLSRMYLSVQRQPAPPPRVVVQRRPAPPPAPPAYEQYDDRDYGYEDREYNQGYDNNAYAYGGPYGDANDNRFDRQACFAGDADWLVGRAGTGGNINRARDDANARVVRVLEPGEFYTQDFRADRLTIEVDARNIVVDVHCG
jgi:uncharacterized protein YraI